MHMLFVMTSYYVDPCIWKDYYDNREEPQGKPLGKFALFFLHKVMTNRDTILISRLTFDELQKYHSSQELLEMFRLLHMLALLKKVDIDSTDIISAEILSKDTRVPRKDCIHAILAKKHGAILITRDGHFSQLQEYVTIRKPEEL
jgi:predicted nucleic acid-binding protein